MPISRLNPKLLTDFRLGYLRYHVSTEKYDGTADLATQAGIPGLNLGTTFTVGCPWFLHQQRKWRTGGTGEWRWIVKLRFQSAA